MTKKKKRLLALNEDCEKVRKIIRNKIKGEFMIVNVKKFTKDYSDKKLNDIMEVLADEGLVEKTQKPKGKAYFFQKTKLI